MTITREALCELLGVRLRPAVSILMPAHGAGAGAREDPTRLKNLLRGVEADLADRGLEGPETASITDPAHALVDDRAFWRFEERGLALYAAPHFFRAYRVDRPLGEQCLVEERFYVSPLFPLVDEPLDLTEAAAVDRYREREGSGRVSSDLAAVVRASHEGRVDELFAADGAQQWGMFAPGSGSVTLRKTRGPAAVELINLAAVEAFRRGGSVHVFEAARMPEGARLAAILRY